MVVHRSLVLAGVLSYSALVGLLRWRGVIGDRGALILFGVMIADLVAAHWLLARRSRRPDADG